MTETTSPAGADVAPDLAAQRAALDTLEAAPGGTRALEVIQRVAHLSAGERIALTSSWFMGAGGPRTRDFREAAREVEGHLDGEVRDALRTLVAACRNSTQQQAKEDARHPWDLAYWAAAAAVTDGQADPGAVQQLHGMLTEPLGPFPDRMASSTERTCLWLAEHVSDINKGDYDGDEDALPPLTDAQLARVAAWLTAQADAHGVLWPGAGRTWQQYPGEMPPVRLEQRGADDWVLTVAGVGGRKDATRDGVLDAAADMLRDFEERHPDGEVDMRLRHLATWVRACPGPALRTWLEDVTAR
ncbi:hypothetical protein [Actinotalea ferrariae]|nr:hypothetical protein [Actinotalea ferrariae]